MKYEDQLTNYRWLQKRNEIIRRDVVCQDCGSSENLNVHHIAYIGDRDAWNYPDNLLITLCRKCHSEEHKYQKLIQDKIKEYRQSGALSREIYEVLFNK